MAKRRGARDSLRFGKSAGFGARNDAAVIPGHREAMSPESISPLTPVARWIPGSRCARPGMTTAYWYERMAGLRFSRTPTISYKLPPAVGRVLECGIINADVARQEIDKSAYAGGK